MRLRGELGQRPKFLKLRLFVGFFRGQLRVLDDQYRGNGNVGTEARLVDGQDFGRVDHVRPEPLEAFANPLQFGGAGRELGKKFLILPGQFVLLFFGHITPTRENTTIGLLFPILN